MAYHNAWALKKKQEDPINNNTSILGMLSVASSTAVPAPDSLAQMLIQALTAQDHALLEEVGHCGIILLTFLCHLCVKDLPGKRAVYHFGLVD